MKTIKRLIKRIVFSCLPSSSVLMFHHIDDGKIIEKSGCRLDKSKFLQFIDSGISFISLDAYCQFHFSRKNPCAVTFDDGLQDVYRVAFPELKKRNIPFTVFVVTGFLDTEGYLSTAELIEMANDPLVTVGSHGVTHDIFKGMPLEKQQYELTESKRLLQELTGKEIRYFAYSHGQYDRQTIEILKNDHIYDFSFSAGGGRTNFLLKRNCFTLPRMNIVNQSTAYRIQKKGKNSILKYSE